ncbi:MAG: hypothetical protein QXI58_00740 [Candidatus Micrarchaeia archaeon]
MKKTKISTEFNFNLILDSEPDIVSSRLDISEKKVIVDLKNLPLEFEKICLTMIGANGNKQRYLKKKSFVLEFEPDDFPKAGTYFFWLEAINENKKIPIKTFIVKILD